MIDKDNLRRVISLRNYIKNMCLIVRIKYPSFFHWCDEIDFRVDYFLEKYLDEPTQTNFDNFAAYWHNYTAPAIKKILTSDEADLK